MPSPPIKAEDEERVPIPCEAAADGRYEIEDGGDAEGFAAAEALTDLASGERTDDGADEAYSYGKPLFVGRKTVKADQGVNGARYDNGIEAEEQASERASERGSHEVEVGSHRGLALAVQLILHSGCGGSKTARKSRLAIDSAIAGRNSEDAAAVLAGSCPCQSHLTFDVDAVPRIQNLVNAAGFQVEFALKHVDEAACGLLAIRCC